MDLPELPEGWTWEYIKLIDLRNWGFKLYQLEHFGEHYQSITLHLGPFIWQHKSRRLSDHKKGE